jgi:hypothetical protein
LKRKHRKIQTAQRGPTVADFHAAAVVHGPAFHIIEEVGVSRPGMANLTRSVLSKVMAYAIEIGERTDNPFAGLKRYRLGTYHTWTDAEIAQFERRWPLGTRERLAFALLLYTGQRAH